MNMQAQSHEGMKHRHHPNPLPEPLGPHLLGALYLERVWIKVLPPLEGRHDLSAIPAAWPLILLVKVVKRATSFARRILKRGVYSRLERGGLTIPAKPL
jgi:hypothetical protein